MRFIKWSMALLLVAILTISAIYGALLFVNREDESLSAEAKTFAASATLNIPPEQNGYFAALGWRTAVKDEPHVLGLWLFEGRRDLPIYHTLTHELPAVLGVPEPTDLCDRKRADCLEMVSRKREIVQKVTGKHAILLARIRNLESYPYFHTPRLAIKNPWQIIRSFEYSMVWRLGATASAYAWLSGNFQEAITATAARIAVARRMVRDSGSALDTALGVAWLRSEYLLISEILQRDPDAARVHMNQIEPLLVPLTKDELQAVRWVQGEFSGLVEQYSVAARDDDAMRLLLSQLFLDVGPEEMVSRGQFRASLPRWYFFLSDLLAPLFQPHATANLHYKILSRFEDDARASSKEVGAMAFRNNRKLNAHTRQLSMFNPVGRAIDVVEPYEFLFRVHDIDRFIRLVAVQAALTGAQVATQGVGNFIANYADAVDPATGQRMHWDVARSRIHVPAMAKLWTRYSGRLGAQIGEISVPYKGSELP